LKFADPPTRSSAANLVESFVDAVSLTSLQGSLPAFLSTVSA